MSKIDVGSAVQIERVDLYRYVCPVHASRSHLPSRGLVVRIRASGSSGPVEGVGEAFVVADQSNAAWDYLEKIAKDLVGARLPAMYKASRSRVLVQGFRRASSTDLGWRRSAKLAVEVALLDLSMKASGATTFKFWEAATRPAPVVRPRAVRLPKAMQDETDHESTLHPLRERVPELPAGGLTKLRSTGDPNLDLAWMRRFGGSEGAGDQVFWLVDVRLELSAAERFVSDLARQIAEGNAPSRVLLEEPVIARSRTRLSKLRERSFLSRLQGRSPLSKLQQIADEMMGSRAPAALRERLAIMASDGIGSMAQVRRLYGGWPLGALYLSLPHWGSLQALREAAVAAKAADPGTLVILGGARGSRITGQALEKIAAATPEIDFYTPEELSSKWPRLVPEVPADSLGEGLVGGLDIGELSRFVERAKSIPTVPAGTSAGIANRFPDHPLLAAPSGIVRSLMLETEALRVGLRTRRFAREFFLAEDGSSRVTGFSNSELATTSMTASVATMHKAATRELLSSRGLPVADGRFVADEDKDKAYAAGLELGFPLVVKPAGGSKGVGVTTNITTADELAHALDVASSSKYGDTGLIVERFVVGGDYRVVATRQEVLSVIHREPAYVIGDGAHTVEELALLSNVIRRQNPHLGKRLPIPMDERVDLPLRRQGLDRSSIPATGQKVQLSTVANVSQGGNSREVLDTTHPSVLDLAKDAVAAIPGLPYAGVDLLMDDHQVAVDDQSVTVLEINPKPVQTMHHFPMYGPPRNVSGMLVKEAAGSAGLRITPPADTLAVQLVVVGRVRGVGYRRWMARTARQLALTGWVGNAQDADEVKALLQGAPYQVGLMLRMAFTGPQGATVTETHARPVQPHRIKGFSIKKNPE